MLLNFNHLKQKILQPKILKKQFIKKETTNKEETQFDMLKKLELNLEMHKELFLYCKKKK